MNARRPASAETLGRLTPDGAGVLVAGADLAAVEVGLLEVVADDFLVLGCPVACCAFEPAPEALVQFAARLFGNRLIGRVTNE